jgi:hypothetical protein
MAGLGFTKSDSSSTGRQQTGVQFPKQFVLDLHKTIGGPITIADLFKLAPRPHSLFGYGPKQGEQRGGSFSLGFGPPAPSARTLPEGVGGPPHTTAPGTGTPPLGGLGHTPPPAAPRTFRLSDIESLYAPDPEKTMDLPRLFKQAKLDPTAFTYDQLAHAVGKAKKYGFSGRSRGNFARVLAGLQRDEELEDEFAGGRGTGIF